MNRKLLTLAADMLAEASERYGDHGCNDWDWPEGFELKDRKALLDLCELDEEEHWYLVGTTGPPDWMVMQALADMLREAAGRKTK